jgi:ankyrin repeat protein
MICAKQSNLEGVKLLVIEGRANIYARSFDGMTIFSIAVSHCSREIVQFLLSIPGFDAEKSNAALALSLVPPVRDDIIRLVIALDFDINRILTQEKRDRPSMTALISAVERCSLSLLAHIVGHPRFDPILSGVPQALFAAVHSCDQPMITALLPLVGNNVNFRNERNESLLTYACLRGRPAIVALIVNNPTFDPQQQDVSMALAAAIRADMGGSISHLIGLPGLDINARLAPGINGNHLGGLLRSVQRVRSAQTSQRLPELTQGIPPLIAAARLGRLDAVAAILRSVGADVNVRGESGQTVLAEGTPMARVYPILPFERIDINARDAYGQTALFWAIERRDTNAMKELVRKGIDVNVRDVFGVLFVFFKPLGNSRMQWRTFHLQSNQRTLKNTHTLSQS